LARPVCGFDGNGCRVDFFQEYKGYLIVALCLVLMVLGGIIFGIYYLIKSAWAEIAFYLREIN
jgi:hypothetical protein